MIYVVQAAPGTPCKVGLAQNVAKRVAALQTSHPTKLNVLHVWEGGREVEARLHACLAPHRLSGEWFEPVEKLISGAVFDEVPPAAAVRAAPASNLTGMDLIRSVRGLQADLARGLGITRGAVAMWAAVPAERLAEIVEISGIHAADLRPDLAVLFEGVAQ